MIKGIIKNKFEGAMAVNTEKINKMTTYFFSDINFLSSKNKAREKKNN